MTSKTDSGTDYEHALRAIGRHLDSETAYHVRILEDDDGFTVQFQASQQGEVHASHFAWDRLQDLLIFNSAGRGVGGKRRRNTGLWSQITGGREDFFRALGHKLDQERASGISVDELPDNIALTYVCPDPENSIRSDKHHSLLTLDDMRDIQAIAQQRRDEAAATRS